MVMGVETQSWWPDTFQHLVCDGSGSRGSLRLFSDNLYFCLRSFTSQLELQSSHLFCEPQILFQQTSFSAYPTFCQDRSKYTRGSFTWQASKGTSTYMLTSIIAQSSLELPQTDLESFFFFFFGNAVSSTNRFSLLESARLRLCAVQEVTFF